MTLIPAPEKILVINLAFIGDVLLSTPMVRALKENYPATSIDMLVVPLTKPIAEGNPYISEVLTYDKKGEHKKIGNLWSLVKTIRNRRYDLAICTNFAPRGAMLAMVAGIPRRIGYDAQNGKWFLTHAVSAKRQAVRHESENYLDVLAPFKISIKDTSLDFKIKNADIETMRDKIKKIFNQDFASPIAVICPLGSYSKKNWTTENYVRLIKKLTEKADCYLIGDKSQEKELNIINERAGNLAVVLAEALSLGELTAFISVANLLVSVDTGPMHIAEAVKTPLVALFGPTDPKCWGPRSNKSLVFTASLDCSPCWGKTACQNNRCMQELDEAAIIAATEAILEGDRKGT